VRADAGKFRDPVTLAPTSYSDEWQNFSASARFIVDLDERDRFQLFGGVSQAFRAPNMSDLTRDDFSGTGISKCPPPA
jgi:hemoglobin/transferrin/lactoferrin receptor protein